MTAGLFTPSRAKLHDEPQAFTPPHVQQIHRKAGPCPSEKVNRARRAVKRGGPVLHSFCGGGGGRQVHPPGREHATGRIPDESLLELALVEDECGNENVLQRFLHNRDVLVPVLPYDGAEKSLSRDKAVYGIHDGQHRCHGEADVLFVRC